MQARKVKRKVQQIGTIYVW